MSDKDYLAVGVGLCALDYICVVDKFPGPEEKIDARQFSRQGGGPVPTALCALSHFGEKTAFIGKCGGDPEGKLIKEELNRFGVNTRAMVLDPYSRTPRAFIWVDHRDGNRTVVLDRTEIADMKPIELNPVLLKSCRYLHLDGREIKVAIEAAKIAKDAGAQVVLDAGSPRENIHDLLMYVDHMIVSKKFAEDFTQETEPGAASLKMLTKGFKTVVITLGDKGSVCAADGDFYQQDAFDIEPLDTTGAGDVFHGAYIYGLGKGWDLRQTVEFASAAAAMKCVRIGGRQGIPSVDEVVQFMEVKKGRL
ncbi:MAG: hypothetical protein GY839_19830 [candidate division Zixibacteria bacterium]|nr:hypothetical protein [candidate division Zixibacteria bacterium]